MTTQPVLPPPPRHATTLHTVPVAGLAAAALTFGLLFFIPGMALLAIICGHKAQRLTRDGHYAGHGIAVAGTILGWVFGIPQILLLGGAIGFVINLLGGTNS